MCGESCTASYTSIKFAQTKTLRTEALSVCTLIFRFPAGFGTLCFRTGCRASQGLSPQPLLISRYSVVFREISYHLFVRLSRRVSLFLDISTKLIRIFPRSTGSFPKQVSTEVMNGLQQQRPPPVAETGSCCWGRGQRDARAIARSRCWEPQPVFTCAGKLPVRFWHSLSSPLPVRRSAA